MKKSTTQKSSLPPKKDCVDEASAESFPASDPPAWIGGKTGGPHKPAKEKAKKNP